MTKICAISDVHGKWNKVTIPECDILISAGDYSFKGEHHMVRDFHKWLDKQPAKHIISVQGNHEKIVEADFLLAKQIAVQACPRVHFIDEGLVEIEGLKIYGSAITPWFHNWAWNRMRGPDIKKHWDKIPDDIDILITHGPTYGILDTVYNTWEIPVDRVGCQDLGVRIKELKNLKHHICGHIHCSYGHIEIDGVNYWNAAICDEMYMPTNVPHVFEAK